MKSFKKNLILIVSLLFLIPNAQATELLQGVEYNSGENLTASKAGISFTLPQDWSGSVSTEGDFIMKSNQHYGMLILTSSQTSDRHAMAGNLTRESLDIGSGFVFYPSGKANIETNGLTQNYQGKDPTSGAALSGHLHILEGKYGQSVTIVIMGTLSDSNYNNQLLHNTLNTVSFFDQNVGMQQTQGKQQKEAIKPAQQRRPVIENWSGGGYVQGINNEGRNCSYVTVQGMSMRSCD